MAGLISWVTTSLRPKHVIEPRLAHFWGLSRDVALVLPREAGFEISRQLRLELGHVHSASGIRGHLDRRSYCGGMSNIMPIERILSLLRST